MLPLFPDPYQSSLCIDHFVSEAKVHCVSVFDYVGAYVCLFLCVMKYVCVMVYVFDGVCVCM